MDFLRLSSVLLNIGHVPKAKEARGTSSLSTANAERAATEPEHAVANGGPEHARLHFQKPRWCSQFLYRNGTSEIEHVDVGAMMFQNRR